MKRSIVTWVKGDIDTLFRKWTIPQGVTCRTRDIDKIILSFPDDYVDDFYHFKEITEEMIINNFIIKIDSTFNAYDFTKEELLTAELLHLRALCQVDLEVIDPKPVGDNPEKVEMADEIKMYSSKSIESQIILTDTNLMFFHEDLVKTMKQNGLGQSLFTVPCTIQIQDKKICEKWLWISSKVDLGNPLIENRFLIGFQRNRWQGEDFCISKFYGSHIAFVSQRIFRFLDALSESTKSGLIFEPIELL
jgi:hypothetical protein